MRSVHIVILPDSIRLSGGTVGGVIGYHFVKSWPVICPLKEQIYTWFPQNTLHHFVGSRASNRKNIGSPAASGQQTHPGSSSGDLIIINRHRK